MRFFKKKTSGPFNALALVNYKFLTIISILLLSKLSPQTHF